MKIVQLDGDACLLDGDNCPIVLSDNFHIGSSPVKLEESNLIIPLS